MMSRIASSMPGNRLSYKNLIKDGTHAVRLRRLEIEMDTESDVNLGDVKPGNVDPEDVGTDNGIEYDGVKDDGAKDNSVAKGNDYTKDNNDIIDGKYNGKHERYDIEKGDTGKHDIDKDDKPQRES